MTTEQINKLRQTLVTLFGDAIVEVQDEGESIYVEAHRAAVMIVPDVREVSTILGERHIPCWTVGTLDDDGEFQEMDRSDSFWGVAAQTASRIASQAVMAVQFGEFVHQLGREDDWHV